MNSRPTGNITITLALVIIVTRLIGGDGELAEAIVILLLGAGDYIISPMIDRLRKRKESHA